MKKLFISISLVISCFFFFNTSNVDASTDFPINYDINEHFNFFYEQQKNTPFYQLLLENSDFCSYLQSISNDVDCSQILIAYTKDVSLRSNSSDIPKNAYYTIVVPYSRAYISFTSGKYSFYQDPVTYYDNLNELFHYDINGNFISKTTTQNNKTTSTVLNFDVESVKEESYLLSALYYTKNSTFKITPTYKTLRLNYLIINNEKIPLQLEQQGWFDRLNKKIVFGILGWFQEVSWGNISNYGLEYFSKNYYISSENGAIGLNNILFYDSTYKSVSVPDNFNSKTFSNDTRYFLIPNSKSCTSTDSLLFFSTNNISSINLINYSLLDNNFINSDLSAYSFSLKAANRIEALNLYSIIPKESSIYNYAYYIYSNDNFYVNTFYYNPSCYSAYDAINSGNLEFVNVNDDSTITLTPLEQEQFYNRASDSTLDLIKNSTSDSTDVDISSIIGSAWSGAKTFISSSYYIMSMTTTLFGLLPASVGSLILCVFSLGMVIILWKVFRS